MLPPVAHTHTYSPNRNSNMSTLSLTTIYLFIKHCSKNAFSTTFFVKINLPLCIQKRLINTTNAHIQQNAT